MKPSDNEIEMLAAGFSIQHKNGLIRFAHALLDKYAPQASAEDVRELPDAEMRTLVGNYFADDWAKEAAAGLLHDCARSLKTQADKDGGQQREGVVTDDMRYAVRFAPSSAHWSERLKEFFGPDAREGIDALERQLREAHAMLDRQERAGDDLIHALGECRDAFPTPDIAGSRLDLLWQEAMSDPTAVPAYVKACAARAALSAPQAEQGERDA